MNKKFVYGIAVMLAAAASVYAAEEAQGMTLEERVAALEAGTKESGWEGNVRVKGDVRYRFQHVQSEDTVGNDLDTSKNIQRIRMRLGVYADVNDFTEAAVGIRTGDSANSGNVTLGDGFDGMPISLSLAYLRLIPEEGKYGSLTMGKMKQPWKSSTDLFWDPDVNPEGIAYAYEGKAKNTGLFGNTGFYKVVDNSASADATLYSLQGGVAQPLGEKIKGTLGGSMYYYENAVSVAMYPVDYRMGEAFTELGFSDVGPIPFKLYGNYVNNAAVDDENQGYCFGVKFGDAKKAKWEAKYDYRDLELYAAPGAFADSDFADGGSGVKGHRIKAKYNFAKNLQGGIAYIYAERTPERTTTAYSQQFNSLFLDLLVAF